MTSRHTYAYTAGMLVEVEDEAAEWAVERGCAFLADEDGNPLPTDEIAAEETNEATDEETAEEADED